MAPNRFRKDTREKREVTPFSEDPPALLSGVAPPEIPPEWRDIEAPVNFTWVTQDELAGMGWPKSRDQVRFLISQGIDHLITLATDKMPPHYAFPELKFTIIPVEDFTGPTISDIKTFIDIMDDARRNGEAVGVHCAEGRGRTGVMCACYLIYYHDMQPWDAIRIMRRQRPGSVERKVQEETVEMFYDLLNDYDGCSLNNLVEKEKEWKRERQREKLINEQNFVCNYTAMLYGPAQKRADKKERMRRSRSMPKMNEEIDEAVKEETKFKIHMQEFFESKRRSSRDRRPPIDHRGDENSEPNRFGRATTPGRTLVDNLKPAPRKSDVVEVNNEPKCDFRQHFKDFMSGSAAANVKRARSFSQPRDKNNANGRSSPKRRLSRMEDHEKQVEDARETEAAYRRNRKLYTAGGCTPTSSASGSSVSCSRSASVESSSGVDLKRENSKEDDGEEHKEIGGQAAENHDMDKPVHDEPDNRIADGDNEKRFSKDSDESSEAEPTLIRIDRKSSVTSTASGEYKPPQPKYKPKYNVESTSSTYSYYARVRSRAEVARKREQEQQNGGSSSKITFDEVTTSAPSSTVTTRKFDNNRSNNNNRGWRSKTVEKDMLTTSNSSNSTVNAKVSVASNSEDKTVITVNGYDYGEDNPPVNGLPTANEEQRDDSEVAAILSAAALNSTSIGNKKIEARTSSDSLRVEATKAEDKYSRLSPFNRFRSSLVSGANNNNNSNTTSPTSSNSKVEEPPPTGGRRRTESTSEASGAQRRRFFYRKSRTGPISGSGEAEVNSPDSSPSVSAATSTGALAAATMTAVTVTGIDPHGIRAKSEFTLRRASEAAGADAALAAGVSGSGSGSTSASAAAAAASTSGSGYVRKDNYLLAAAKKWASYDKPNYNTPFNRDSWKRSHRKFNYSRFLTYTRETFV